MPTTPCIAGYNNFNKPIAQTLFLGASVADFNVSLGWGGQASSVNLSLVRDFSPYSSKIANSSTLPCVFGSQYINHNSGNSPPNHYHDVAGSDDNLYLQTSDGPVKDKMSGIGILRGKVRYAWNSGLKKFVSYYWTDPDPGFFGIRNNWTINGAYPGASRGPDYYHSDNDGYDIINTPVYFRLQDFEFIGLVKNFSYQDSSSGQNISVTLESPLSLLSNAFVITSGFQGSVSLYNSSTFRALPQNYSDKTHTSQQWNANVHEGGVHNLFNVFGFLETYYGFGASGLNDQGVPTAFILDALEALTSSTNITTRVQQFSTYGRIVCKSVHSLADYTYPPNGSNFWDFGLIPPDYSLQPNGHPLNAFALDLSELPRFNTSVRISEPIISILDLITQITDIAGLDFFIDCIPAYSSAGGVIPTIKVRTVNRLKQPSIPQVRQNIQNLISDAGYQDLDGQSLIQDISYGQEYTESIQRKVVIGAKQQRLYQAKNYRLAFSQNTFRLHWLGNIPKVVDYTYYNKSAYKIPTGYSTRNTSKTVNQFSADDIPTGSVISVSEYNTILNLLKNYEKGIKNDIDGSNFDTTESVYSDTQQLFVPGSVNTQRLGNYLNTTEHYYHVGPQGAYPSVSFDPTRARFTPLFYDVISPFFGFRLEENNPIPELGEESRRQPRPVYMDNYTGQILVVCDIGDLAGLRFNLQSLYGASGSFIVSETEMRAATAGFDNLVLYYTYKMLKSDLFLMLRNAYVAANISPFRENGPIAGLMPFGMLDDDDVTGTDGGPAPPDPVGDDSIDSGAGDIIYSKSFTEDLQTIHNFISQLASKYYGKSYMVRLPKIEGYRDWEDNSTINIGTDGYGEPINIWKGPPKSFLTAEIATDGGWEEFGNLIDEDIVVGSPNSFNLMDDAGKIQPILGYNASDMFDYVGHYLCSNQTAILNTRNAHTVRRHRANNVFDLDTYSLVGDNYGVDCDNRKFVYPGVDLSSIAGTNFVSILGSATVRNSVGIGTRQPFRKVFVTASVRPKMVFETPSEFTNPRAIIESPGLFLNSSSLSHTQDMNRTLLPNIALEDLTQILFSNTSWTSNSQPWSSIIKALWFRVCSIYDNKYIRKRSTQSNANQMIDISPKAAHPFFAAIPIKSNQYTYGPWTNLPYESRNNIITNSSLDQINVIDNMVDGLSVEIDEDLAPWNYGGMSLLDKAALLKVGDGLKYQNVSENASFTFPGTPKFGLGSKLTGSYDTSGDVNFSLQPFNLENTTLYGESVNHWIYSYRNDTVPSISNIQLKIGSSGISTTYSLKMYSKPLSRFNKDAADRLKRAGLSAIKSNKALATARNEASSKLVQVAQQSVATAASGGVAPFTASSKKLLGWSPSTVLVGMGGYYLSSPTAAARRNFSNASDGSNNPNNPKSSSGSEQQPGKPAGTASSSPSTVNTSSSIGYANNRKGYSGGIMSEFNRSTTPNTDLLHLGGQLGVHMREVRHGANVALYQEKELSIDINNDYANKGFMSLDGIFSPVAFYPTLYNSCYSLAKWPRSKCPFCNGKKIYQDFYYINGTETSVYVHCKNCYDEISETNNNQDVSLQESINTKAKNSIIKQNLDGTYNPPYITVTNNQTDEDILEELYNSGNYKLSSITSINTGSLQPLMQEDGDFLNPNAQPQDKGRHSISIVGRGARQPDNKYEFRINKNLEKTYFGSNPDFKGSEDIRLASYLQKANSVSKMKDIFSDNKNPDGSIKSSYPLNNRYLGLRGPLVVHGWGYDLEGYPVPNQINDAKFINAQGQPKRHVRKQITPSGGGNPVYINEDDYSHEGEYPTASTDKSRLGSIISVTQEWKTINGKSFWTPPKKTDKFALNWGERPDTWPVGPIDLRWDEIRKVWVCPQPRIYKNIHLTLEEDLNYINSSKPARAFLSDFEYDINNSGERKVVYVIDKTGYTAPRGATLLCFYNQDSGFYEVLSKPTFTVLGFVQSGGASASLTLSYMTSKDKTMTDNTISVGFDNVFGYNIKTGDKGLFTFINGLWTLTSVK